VLVGAVAYTYNDIFFNPQGYFWVAMWYALCVVDAVVMKHVADSVPMSTWSRALYNVSAAWKCPFPTRYLISFLHDPAPSKAWLCIGPVEAKLLSSQADIPVQGSRPFFRVPSMCLESPTLLIPFTLLQGWLL
jgi:hypothetical protein